jgi:hydroxypyruvate isomerase
MRRRLNPEKPMNRKPLLSRRSALKAAGAVALATTAVPAVHSETPAKANGNIKQSVCRWCYGRIPLEKLAVEVKKLGYLSLELLVPDEHKVVKQFGLTCAVLGGADIANGMNRKENHARTQKRIREHIEYAAAEAIPAVLLMSGNRRGLPDDEGLKVCAEGIKPIMSFAEEKKVTVLMEGLNSKVDHKDYMYDKTTWGVELCKQIGSPRFKLLYDIYHMQIMEGDVIRTLTKYHEYIGHYHTGGNPGRHEIDETQELNYPAIVKAILKTKFDGYLAQEFLPVRDPVASLAQAFKICDV